MTQANPYLAPARVYAALRALHLRPTRGMGQNFLVDPIALEQIVTSAEVTPSDVVVEVGPGLGVLTWSLLQHAAQVISVELDLRLVERLHKEFATYPTLRIIQGDILNMKPQEILASVAQNNIAQRAQNMPSYKLVANLPYAITAPVLRHFLEGVPSPAYMVVLVQWEVAQRITATPGNLSMLAHAIQFYAEPEIVARVPSESFIPAPAVDSAILRLRVRNEPIVAVDDVKAFFRIIKASFLQPRKKLSNALPGGMAALGQRISRDIAVAALEHAGIAPERRAETVTLAEWAQLYVLLQHAQNTDD